MMWTGMGGHESIQGGRFLVGPLATGDRTGWLRAVQPDSAST